MCMCFSKNVLNTAHRQKKHESNCKTIMRNSAYTHQVFHSGQACLVMLVTHCKCMILLYILSGSHSLDFKTLCKTDWVFKKNK